MTAVVETTPNVDGRWLRSVRTRAAIIDAWVQLIQMGDLSPTAKGVADRAGIGLRTVFQHFSDMNALHGAAAEDFIARVAPCASHIRTDVPLADRIESITIHRSHVFEAVTMVRRACERQEWLSADVHDVIQRWEHLGATDTARVFAPELDAVAPGVRAMRTFSLNAVLSWSTWNHLRARCLLSVDDARNVMVDALANVLT